MYSQHIFSTYAYILGQNVLCKQTKFLHLKKISLSLICLICLDGILLKTDWLQVWSLFIIKSFWCTDAKQIQIMALHIYIRKCYVHLLLQNKIMNLYLGVRCLLFLLNNFSKEARPKTMILQMILTQCILWSIAK